MRLKFDKREDYRLLEMSLGDALDRASSLWADEIGWVFEDESISFRTMKERADRVASALLAADTCPGDVVAAWMPNLPEFAYIEFACAKVGAILVAVNTRSKAFELGHFLSHSRARLLFMVDAFLKHDFRATLDEVKNSQPLPHLRHVISFSADTPHKRWTDFLARAQATHSQLATVQRSRLASDSVLVQYTSGTTARPKAALCDHRYVLNLGGALMWRQGLERGDAFLNTQPFYHIGGSCAAVPAPLCFGARVVVPLYYDVERVLALIERERCVARTGYGAMYIMEMSHPRFGTFDLSSLKGGWCVGPPELMKRVQDEMHIPGLIQIYGATEVNGTSAWVDDPWEVRSATCGSPLPKTELKVIDLDTAQPVGHGVVGEVCLRGWCQMKGYLHDPEATGQALDSDGWIHTGDLGSIDVRGNLRFSGRLKDMLKVGGENVAAGEVESVLAAHPAVMQVAVIGAPDQRLGEVVLAAVELRDRERVSEQDLIRYCAERMANFRVPKYVRFVDAWPLTDSGKIKKNELRELLLYELDPASPARSA